MERMGIRRTAPAALAAIAVLVAACGGGSTTTDAKRTNQTISVWTLENEPVRVQATRANLATFTRRTGIRGPLRAPARARRGGARERRERRPGRPHAPRRAPAAARERPCLRRARHAR